MEFTTILDSRKSVRTYTGEPISEESLKKIIHAANIAPVGLAKYETLHLTVVKSKEMLAELEKNAAELFKTEGRSYLYGAPELIIVSTSATDNVGYSNAAIVAQNMALAAVDEGVGTCHIWGCMMALMKNPELIKKLGIPEGFTPTCSVVLGQTEETYAPRDGRDDRISMNCI